MQNLIVLRKIVGLRYSSVSDSVIASLSVYVLGVWLLTDTVSCEMVTYCIPVLVRVNIVHHVLIYIFISVYHE